MMRLSTALILVGVTACVYGKKPVPGQHLSKFLNALHVSERAQRAMKYWDNIAEQNVNPSPLYGYPARESNSPEKRYGQNGKKKPSPSPASSHERYTSEERSGDENQEERYPSGYGKPNGYPFPSGKPFTNGPPTGGQPVRNLPEDDDDRDIAQLIHELRQIFEEQYKKNTINSYNSDNTKPTYGPQHTKPTSKVPESDDDDDDDNDDNFTNTHSTRPTDGPITNLKEKTDRRKVAELLGNLSRILKRYNNNDSFTTDSSPTGTPATTESPGDDEDNDRDDDDDIRGLAECWMNDVLGDFFRGFPNGPITNNLTIDGSKVHYILTRAVRQFQLSGGEMDEVLESMIKGLVRAVIIPHKTCPATKFHQVVVWGMNFHMKYHLTNNSGSLKEHFKAIFMNSSFDEKESDQIAGYMVSELQGQLQEQAIHFLKNEFLNDFLDPIGYVVKEIIPMFHAPRNNTHIDVLLHDVEENNPWLLRCITPDRLVAMHHNFVYRLNGFVKQKELYEFLDRAEDTLEEEFLVSTGSEQAPLVKQLINVLEAHIRNVVNSSNVYLQALLSDNANHQTSLLAPIMNPSQQAYFQRIMKSLGPINIGTSSVGPITTGTSTPAPVLPPSAPGKRSASRDKDKWIQRMV